MTTRVKPVTHGGRARWAHGLRWTVSLGYDRTQNGWLNGEYSPHHKQASKWVDVTEINTRSRRVAGRDGGQDALQSHPIHGVSWRVLGMFGMPEHCIYGIYVSHTLSVWDRVAWRVWCGQGSPRDEETCRRLPECGESTVAGLVSSVNPSLRFDLHQLVHRSTT